MWYTKSCEKYFHNMHPQKVDPRRAANLRGSFCYGRAYCPLRCRSSHLQIRLRLKIFSCAGRDDVVYLLCRKAKSPYAHPKKMTPGERYLSGGHFAMDGLTVPCGVGQATCRYSDKQYPPRQTPETRGKPPYVYTPSLLPVSGGAAGTLYQISTQHTIISAIIKIFPDKGELFPLVFRLYKAGNTSMFGAGKILRNL